MTLDDYLADQAGRRWKWGSVDCVSFALEWARAKTGRTLTPFCDWASRDEAAAILSAGGGLQTIVARWMAENGFAPTDDPKDGDIGVVPVAFDGAGLPVDVAVMIRKGKFWIGKTPKGIASALVKSAPAWTLETSQIGA